MGLQILHEGVFDKTRAYEGQTNGKATFWYTENIRPHVVTEGVKRLYLPLIGCHVGPGLPAMQYGPQWQIIVRGETEAKSYRSGDDNGPNLDAIGTYANAPPVLAVRTLGKGRIVCYPLSQLFTGMNFGSPLWQSVVETAGDRGSNRPSQGMKLLMNCYKWLAEPALDNPTLGTYKKPLYKPIKFAAKTDKDAQKFGEPTGASVRGIFGAHSAYSDGKGDCGGVCEGGQGRGIVLPGL